MAQQPLPDTYWSRRVAFSEQAACGKFLWEQFKAGRCVVVDVKTSGAAVFADLGTDDETKDRTVSELKAAMAARAVGLLTDEELDSLLEEPAGYLSMVNSLPGGTRAVDLPQPSPLVKRARASASVGAMDHPRVEMGAGHTVSVQMHGLNKAQALLLLRDALQMHEVTAWSLCVGAGVLHGPLRLAPLLESGLKLCGYRVAYQRPFLRVQIREPQE